MKILNLDIETTPYCKYDWEMYHRGSSYTPMNMMVKRKEILCWSAHWYGTRQPFMFEAAWDNKKRMIKTLWEAMCEADAVMGWNTKKFDCPEINTAFALARLGRPSPYKHIDLLLAVRPLRLPSNKLDDVAKLFLNKGKIEHDPMLWSYCVQGDEKARRLMQRYNKRDVVLVEELYPILLPWVHNHPLVTMYDTDPTGCPTCGSKNLIRKGYNANAVATYQRYVCKDCKTWCRGKNQVHVMPDLRQIVQP